MPAREELARLTGSQVVNQLFRSKEFTTAFNDLLPSQSSIDRYRTDIPDGYSSITCLLSLFIIHCADIEVRVPLLLCVPVFAFLSFLFSSVAFLRSSLVSFFSSCPLTTNLGHSGRPMPWLIYNNSIAGDCCSSVWQLPGSMRGFSAGFMHFWVVIRRNSV